MTETSITNAAPENASALQTVIQGQEIQDDADDENRLFIGPSRQDTESKLRSSADMVNR